LQCATHNFSPATSGGTFSAPVKVQLSSQPLQTIEPAPVPKVPVPPETPVPQVPPPPPPETHLPANTAEPTSPPAPLYIEPEPKPAPLPESLPEESSHPTPDLGQSDIANILSNTASALSDARNLLQPNGSKIDVDWLTHLERRVAALEKKVLGVRPQVESSFQKWRSNPNGPFGSSSESGTDSSERQLEIAIDFDQGTKRDAEAPFRTHEPAFQVLSTTEHSDDD
jgi:hypothetical protein